jgi:hypothetical protein
MLKLLRKLCARSSRPAARPAPKERLRCRPSLEYLEERLVQTVTNHGGALLQNVEVQALYIGSDWNSSASMQNNRTYLENYLKDIVNSSYMDMLSNAGYEVMRGSFDPGFTDPYPVNKTAGLTDANIRWFIEGDLLFGLKAPDVNRLYVVFVEDNVAVTNNQGTSSTDPKNGMLGYHTAFSAPDWTGYGGKDIRYAVVPFPGGSVKNNQVPGLSTLNSLTLTTSHELAEAVTDPDVAYKTKGWYDDA